MNEGWGGEKNKERPLKGLSDYSPIQVLAKCNLYDQNRGSLKLHLINASGITTDFLNVDEI